MTRRNDPGRVPPADLVAEESLLGAMMLSRDAIGAAVERRIEPVDFYKPEHGHIYAAMIGMYSAGTSIDVTTLGNELERVGQLDAVGGRKGLGRLMAATPASANAAHYAKIVADTALLRRLISVAGAIAELGYDREPDAREMLDQAEQMIFDVADRRGAEWTADLSTLLTEALDVMEARYNSKAEMLGVETGYRDYDELLLGLQRTTLNIVAARPAIGKSAFALGAALNVARTTGKPVPFFSFEMGAMDLINRMLAMEAGVDLRKIMRGNLTDQDWTRITKAVGAVADAPLMVKAMGRGTVMEMRAIARRLKSRHGDLGLVVVDYLQLVTPTSRTRSGNREQDVAEISRGLKLLAMELDCPVMALSQLNRNLELRQDKRPTMADLRESGALENDADIVTGLYRDEVYNPETDQRGMAEVIVLKHRNGPIGTVRLAFQPQFTRFASMARE